ncbi:hypothetical protein [Rhizorhabdus sp.]|uniref:hypothetical protein n=1 Tax=Rhizorhabdus sp. TaxID=1968843 RepID=UPI0019915D65|nr:hypothetical protein [Rhizorhabdus sp.]MBD3762433.1 hypothetical protein [Rhizorhabdus sp.]
MQDHFWYRPGEKPEKGKDTRPGFRIRMASLMERGEFDAELEGRHQAAPVPAFVMLDTAIAGVHALLEQGEAAELEELLRSFHGDAGNPERGEVSKEERAQIAEIEAVLAKSWPPYRQLVEQNARYRNLMPLLAFQRFVDDFENVTGTDSKPVAFERDKAGNIPDAVLRRIHPALIYAAGNRAYNFQYAAGEEKN